MAHRTVWLKLRRWSEPLFGLQCMDYTIADGRTGRVHVGTLKQAFCFVFVIGIVSEEVQTEP